jgi:hypothetical protein
VARSIIPQRGVAVLTATYKAQPKLIPLRHTGERTQRYMITTKACRKTRRTQIEQSEADVRGG